MDQRIVSEPSSKENMTMLLLPAHGSTPNTYRPDGETCTSEAVVSGKGLGPSVERALTGTKLRPSRRSTINVLSSSLRTNR